MNGIINVYKEKGYTSFDVVAKLRGILKTKKIGHTGTLDPMAEGVLPVCVGNATKVCALLTDKDKEYITSFKLGVTTDTQDITGTILKISDINVTEEDIRQCIMGFVGEISQLTPMYSARKVNGKKLYEYARQGIEVERKTQNVRIYSISDIKTDLDRKIVSMRVACEKGTYIRTLCNDIGEKLGCGAVMTELLRTKVAVFSLENALKLDDIQLLADTNRLDVCMLETDVLFLSYQKFCFDEELEKYVLNGNKLKIDNFAIRIAEGEKVRLYNKEGRFTAIYQREGDFLRVVAMFL